MRSTSSDSGGYAERSVTKQGDYAGLNSECGIHRPSLAGLGLVGLIYCDHREQGLGGSHVGNAVDEDRD
jgi:hypothetical protein